MSARFIRQLACTCSVLLCLLSIWLPLVTAPVSLTDPKAATLSPSAEPMAPAATPGDAINEDDEPDEVQDPLEREPADVKCTSKTTRSCCYSIMRMLYTKSARFNWAKFIVLSTGAQGEKPLQISGLKSNDREPLMEPQKNLALFKQIHLSCISNAVALARVTTGSLGPDSRVRPPRCDATYVEPSSATDTPPWRCLTTYPAKAGDPVPKNTVMAYLEKKIASGEATWARFMIPHDPGFLSSNSASNLLNFGHHFSFELSYTAKKEPRFLLYQAVEGGYTLREWFYPMGMKPLPRIPIRIGKQRPDIYEKPTSARRFMTLKEFKEWLDDLVKLDQALKKNFLDADGVYTREKQTDCTEFISLYKKLFAMDLNDFLATPNRCTIWYANTDPSMRTYGEIKEKAEGDIVTPFIDPKDQKRKYVAAPQPRVLWAAQPYLPELCAENVKQISSGLIELPTRISKTFGESGDQWLCPAQADSKFLAKMTCPPPAALLT